MKGRPLRFLAAALGCWTMGRVAMLATDAAPFVGIADVVLPPAGAMIRARPASPSVPTSPMPRPAAVAGGAGPREPPSGRMATSPWPPFAAMTREAPQRAPTPAHPIVDVRPVLPPPLPPTPVRQGARRLAGSVWGIGRGGGSDASVPGAQLGGSQAGVRLTYALGPARRIALTGRVSTPFAGRGREAAAGVEWRPLAAPVRLVAEQRWSLDGARGGPTLMAIAGLPPTSIGPLEAEAYAQAGAIARGRIDGFADGAARLVRPLARGTLRLDLGIGAWGGAQPGAARLDVGPSIGLGVPVGPRRLRVTLDWRQRIAGRARPGSGPALSIGSDF